MDERPIGMFDSGFGGVNVLAAATRRLPDEDFIFLGDNLRAPYGDRTPQEVLQYTREAMATLTGAGCKAIVIACNTATSAAAQTLRAELSLPIIGMEPALKPASQLPKEGAVLVMATSMTLHLEKFHQLMARYGQNAVPVPCPGLVELIEAGETEGPRIRAKLGELLSPHLQQPVKAVVLGCTHYVFLKSALREFLPGGVSLVDGNEGTVRQLQKQLAARGLLNAASAAPSGGAGLALADAAPGAHRRAQISFLSTAPGNAIPNRMREWFLLALAELDAACNSTVDTVK